MLEFLPELFDSLKGEAYALMELEAAIFLPCLIEKVLFIKFNYMCFAICADICISMNVAWLFRFF